MASEENLQDMTDAQAKELGDIVRETIQPEAGTEAAREVAAGKDPADVAKPLTDAVKKSAEEAADSVELNDREKAVIEEARAWGSGKSEVE